MKGFTSILAEDSQVMVEKLPEFLEKYGCGYWQFISFKLRICKLRLYLCENTKGQESKKSGYQEEVRRLEASLVRFGYYEFQRSAWVSGQCQRLQKLKRPELLKKVKKMETFLVTFEKQRPVLFRTETALFLKSLALAEKMASKAKFTIRTRVRGERRRVA